MKTTDSFEAISLDHLRRRSSEKWTTFPPDVLPAFVAEMDFALAEPIRRVLDAAIATGDCGYASPCDLREPFVSFAQKRFDWRIEPERVFAVPDVMAGITQALHLLTEHGGSVVINPPVYPPFFEVVRTSERTLIEVELAGNAGAGWSIDLSALEEAFARGAQAYVLCSPHNPVGRIWSESELRSIAELAAGYGVAVISDEIHAPLAMPGQRFVPFLTVAHSDQPSIALTSASKAWNIAGLKCGVMIAGSERTRAALRDRLCAMPTEIQSRIGHLGVLASIAAFTEGAAWLDDLLEHLDCNRRLLSQLLAQYVPDAVYAPPQASYLAWIDCSNLQIPDEPAHYFLQRGRVALEYGSKFGKAARAYVRLNFGTSRAIVTEIVRRMSAASAGDSVSRL